KKRKRWVALPPDFTVSDPQHLTYEEGTTAVIPCQLTVPTNYILMVKKLVEETNKEQVLFLDTTKVPRLAEYEHFSVNNGNMEISNVKRGDAGEYICRLESDEPKEVHHHLDVQYSPNIVNTSSSEQLVRKGHSVKLMCDAEGNPKPEIHWSKKEGKLPSGAKDETGLSMTMEDVDRHVAGTYICTADNGIGAEATKEMTVIVDYAPEISTEKEIVRTGDGDKVELVCVVHAHPNAKVTWRKDNQATTFAAHYHGHKHTLIIPRVSEDDFGVYECLAENDIGSATDTVHLTGHPNRPEITSDPNGGEDTSYTLTWDTESYYPITEYRLTYRRAKANDSTDHPGDWHGSTFAVNNVTTNNLQHSLSHTLETLEPATEYHGALKVRNKYDWSADTEFQFNTNKDGGIQRAFSDLNNGSMSSSCIVRSSLRCLS
ncbi:hypothetical protein Pcinc_021763, partial [Petrolisthes cinctipes]